MHLVQGEPRTSGTGWVGSGVRTKGNVHRSRRSTFPRTRSQSYRFKLPNIPRTSARPTCVATVRATLFIAASTTVSRW